MSVVVQQQANQVTGIKLSENAKSHIVSFLSKKPGSVGVRFSVKKTGCSGLSYVVDYIMSFPENDIVIPLTGDYNIFIDKNSYPFLKGMGVDYVKQGLNHKFVFDNPNQKGQCGCGESFTA